MKLKTRNVILSTAVASALLALGGAANAGTLTTTNTSFATENFGTAFAAGTTIIPGVSTYSMSAATNVNSGTPIYFVVRLANAKFSAAPAVGTLTFAGTAPAGAAVPTISNDRTTMQVTITPTANASLGIGAFSYTPAAGDINAVGALATAGSTITTTVVVTTASTSTTALDSTNALPATVDAPAPTGTIASSANAISASLDANMSAYSGRIDLTAIPPSSGYRNTAGTAITNVALGSVTFTNVTGTQGQYLASGTDYTIAAGSAGGALTDAKIDVTPGTGQAFPVGAKLFYDNVGSGCSAGAGTTTAFTATTSTAKTTITVVTASVVTAVPIFVCMTAPSTGNTASPITPTITATLTPAVTADAGRSVTGTGFPLVLNGSQVDVRNYVPVAQTGWTTFLRVINTGSVAAPITAAVISEAGAVSAAGTLITSLAAGAATTLNSTQIEAVIGAQAASARPRVRIAGSTNGLDVQTYVFTPGGAFSIIHGKE